MPALRSFVIVFAAAFAACSDTAVMQDPKGKWRVLAQIRAGGDEQQACAAIGGALRGHSPAGLAALDAAGLGAARKCDSAVQVVAVAPTVPAAPRPNETFVIEPTGAAAGISLALLACNGIELPHEIGLGVRVVTAANAAAGGEQRPAPGDLAMLMLGREHADVLTTRPAIDVVFSIAFVQSRADAWFDLVRDEVRAEAGRYAQLALETHTGAGDAKSMRDLVEQCVKKEVRAVLLATDDWDALQSVAASAADHKIALIGFDRSLRAPHVAASVGCDPRVLGRTVGDAVARLLPGGGALVELHGDLTADAARRRHEGFAEALGLRPR